MHARVVVAAVVATLVIGLVAAPAGAKTKNPCRVLKTSEIQSALGATVGAPTRDRATAVSTQCKWAVDANADHPKGDIIVHFMFKGGEAAYNGLKANPSAGYTPVAGLAKSLYSPRTGALSVLKGGVYLTVQGVFIDITNGVHQVDVEPKLIDLIKLGLKRV